MRSVYAMINGTEKNGKFTEGHVVRIFADQIKANEYADLRNDENWKKDSPWRFIIKEFEVE